MILLWKCIRGFTPTELDCIWLAVMDLEHALYLLLEESHFCCTIPRSWSKLDLACPRAALKSIIALARPSWVIEIERWPSTNHDLSKGVACSISIQLQIPQLTLGFPSSAPETRRLGEPDFSRLGQYHHPMDAATLQHLTLHLGTAKPIILIPYRRGTRITISPRRRREIRRGVDHRTLRRTNLSRPRPTLSAEPLLTGTLELTALEAFSASLSRSRSIL
jgi:hypothetical protein